MVFIYILFAIYMYTHTYILVPYLSLSYVLLLTLVIVPLSVKKSKFVCMTKRIYQKCFDNCYQIIRSLLTGTFLINAIECFLFP